MSELRVFKRPIKTNVFGRAIVRQPYYLKSDADKVIAKKDKELRHHKYHRCLDAAERCDVAALFYGNAIPKVLDKDITDPSRQKVFRRLRHYIKWRKRWLELAEKCKPNNSTAQ